MSGIRSLGYLRIESADVGRLARVRRPGARHGRGPRARAGRAVPADGRLPGPAGGRAGGAGPAGSPPAGRSPDEAALAEVPSGRWPRPGVAVKRGHAGGAAPTRRVAQLLFASTTRPATRWRSSAAPRSTHRPFVSAVREPVRHRGDGAGPRRAAGHRRRAAALRFYTDVAGLPAAGLDADGAGAVRPAAGPPLWMRFLGCNPRHHSLALAPFPAGARDRAPDDRGRLAGRRRPGAGPVRPARRPGQRHASAGTPTT